MFQRIADAALRHAAVPATLNAPPPVLVAERQQMPAQPTAGPVNALPIVPLHGPSLAAGSAFPDLRGLSARDALRRLAKAGLAAQMSGDGYVVSQDPAPGAPIDPKRVCRVTLERVAFHAAAGAQP